MLKGARIRQLRVQKKVTLRQMATAIGIRVNELIELEESSRIRWSQPLVEKIAEYLGTTVDYLTNGSSPYPF